MTKLITSLDQLERGMSVLVDTHHITEKYVVGDYDEGRDEWEVQIQNLFFQSAMTLNYSRQKMNSLFLNKKVEVPE